MSNPINTDSTISLSVAMLIKVGFLVMVVTGSWYQAQMQFAEHQRKIEDLQNKVTVLNASVEGMETQHMTMQMRLKYQKMMVLLYLQLIHQIPLLLLMVI